MARTDTTVLDPTAPAGDSPKLPNVISTPIAAADPLTPPAPTAPLTPTAPRVARRVYQISSTTLTNLRAYAESGDAAGMARYIDRDSMLALLDAYEDQHRLSGVDDQLQNASTQRDEARDVLRRLLGALNDAARIA